MRSASRTMYFVRIVGQAHEVATKFFRTCKQRAGILCRCGTSAAVRFLLVQADALQEDRVAVEQYLLAARLDGAETDAVDDGFAIQLQLYPIEFWIGWAPK